MIIGDVLGTTFLVLAVCVSLWALLVGIALVFRESAASARGRLEARPGHALAVGALVGLVAGGLGTVFANLPNGLVKLIGWALLLGLTALAALGGGGMALLVGARIQDASPRLSPFGALGRGAGLLIAAGLVPLLGWFLVVPLSLLAALGAGASAVFAAWQAGRPRRRTHPVLAGGGPPPVVPEGAGSAGMVP
jgi:hypothetical protein